MFKKPTAALAVGALAFAAADARADDAEIRCDSEHFRRTECPIDLDRWTVRLERDLSAGRRCRAPGRWGVTDDGVYVDDGCKALFELRPRASALVVKRR